MSDPELLHHFAHRGSQEAFATLVQRHLDLVYSAARRQVRSPQLAEEVAQSVFLDLARSARNLKPGTPLVAWLFVVTRRTAIDALRREAHRQKHERAAAEIAAMSSEPPAWSHIEPLLDEAMAALPEPDRTAILLRFFENKSLRAVGEALGTNDDAAQKRVSRALEQLRAFFTRRGVTVSASGLVSGLSAQAMQIAPHGLATTIMGASMLPATTATMAAGAAPFLIMSSLQKSIAVIAFSTVGAACVYETALAARRADDHADVRQQNARALTALDQARTAHASVTARLAAVEREIDSRLAATKRTSSADAEFERHMAELLGNLDRVRDFIARRPELNIPELKLLKEEQWLRMAASGPLADEDAIRELAAEMRRMAENIFVPRLQDALRSYLKTNSDILPTQPRDLAPFFEEPVDSAILDRYEVLFTGKLSDVAPADRRRILSLRSPADPELDTLWSIGLTSHGGTRAMGVNLTEALHRFSEANGGRRATTAAELRPYLRWPVSDAAVQKMLERMSAPPPK